MTDESMARLDVAENHADGDFLTEPGQFVLQRLMELEVNKRCGADLHERSAERVDYHDSCWERALKTWIGMLQSRIPKFGTGSYFSSFLEPRKASERALVAVVQKSYLRARARAMSTTWCRLWVCRG